MAFQQSLEDGEALQCVTPPHQPIKELGLNKSGEALKGLARKIVETLPAFVFGTILRNEHSHSWQQDLVDYHQIGQVMHLNPCWDVNALPILLHTLLWEPLFWCNCFGFFRGNTNFYCSVECSKHIVLIFFHLLTYLMKIFCLSLVISSLKLHATCTIHMSFPKSALLNRSWYCSS